MYYEGVELCISILLGIYLQIHFMIFCYIFFIWQISRNATKCGNLIEKLPASLFTCKLKVSNQIKVNILNNFKTMPMFDKVNGMYACEIQMLTPVAEFINILNNNELNLDLEVRFLFYCTFRMNNRFLWQFNLGESTVISFWQHWFLSFFVCRIVFYFINEHNFLVCVWIYLRTKIVQL